MLEQDNFPTFKSWKRDSIRCFISFYVEEPRSIRPEIDVWLLPKLQEVLPEATTVIVDVYSLQNEITCITAHTTASLDRIWWDMDAYVRKNAIPYSVGPMSTDTYGSVRFSIRQLTLLEYVADA